MKAGWSKAKRKQMKAKKAGVGLDLPEQPKSFEPKKSEFKEAKPDPDTGAKRRRLDPLTERLGEVGYYNQMRWPWLLIHKGGVNYPLEVTRFYGGPKLAIDIEPDEDIEVIDEKARLCHANGIKYIILENPGDFDSLEKYYIKPLQENEARA